jgi:hypothetical protein
LTAQKLYELEITRPGKKIKVISRTYIRRSSAHTRNPDQSFAKSMSEGNSKRVRSAHSSKKSEGKLPLLANCRSDG